MIVDEFALITYIEALQKEGSIGLCVGCFDVLHIGHFDHIKQAADQVDTLVVSITPDAQITKGMGRPVFRQDIRAAQVDQIKGVDFVCIRKDDEPPAELIFSMRPDIYFKGSDVKHEKNPGFEAEKQAIFNVNGILVYTDVIHGEHHSSEIVEAICQREL